MTHAERKAAKEACRDRILRIRIAIREQITVPAHVMSGDQAKAAIWKDRKEYANIYAERYYAAFDDLTVWSLEQWRRRQWKAEAVAGSVL